MKIKINTSLSMMVDNIGLAKVLVVFVLLQNCKNHPLVQCYLKQGVLLTLSPVYLIRILYWLVLMGELP